METQKFNIDEYDINKNYVIEASAGTGKTYNVVNMVKKMLSQNVNIKDILIVTYTDKACGELKDRIRKISGDISEHDLNIYTIHSFCQNTIKTYGFSANLALNLNMEDDDTLNRFVKRYVRHGAIFEDINNLIKAGYSLDVSKIEKDLINGIKKYYLNSYLEEDETIVFLGEVKDEYKDYVVISKDNLDCTGLFNLLITLKKASCFEDFASIIPTALEYLEVFENPVLEKDKPKTYIKFYESLTNIDVIKDGFKFNGHSFSLKSFKENQEEFCYFKSLKELCAKLTKETEIILFYKHLNQFYKSYQEYKVEQRIESFDDMIRFVREAVIKKDSLLTQKLKEKYKYAIIDEFQDTNQKQFDIFKSIFMTDENHHIVVVGDPKQSIYSFQGADISVYFDAKEEIIKNGYARSLIKNYRSTEEMVKSSNALFETYKFDKYEFEPSLYKNLDDNDSDVLDTLYSNSKSKALYVVGNKENPINEYDFARIACQAILDMCEKEDKHTKLQIENLNDGTKRDVSFKDFTVLARTRAEFEPIKRALKKAGIPYIQYKNEGVYNGIECAQVIALLEALLVTDFTGDNRRSFLKVLTTKFFGYKLSNVKAEYFTHDDIPEMALIEKWRNMLFSKIYEALLDSIINDSNLITNLSGPKDIETLSIFKQIVSYSVSYLSKGNTLEQLIMKLKGLSNGEDDDEDTNGKLVEKASDFNAVQIMTIHASKGLQFPIVICAGGFKGLKENKVDVYNKKLMYTVNKEEGESIAEPQRLYYVAYTRAVNVMILPRYKDSDRNLISKFLNESLDNVLERHKELVYELKDNEKTYKELLSDSKEILKNNKPKNLDKTSIDEQKETIKKLIAKEYEKVTYKHSYTSLTHKSETVDLDNKEGDKNEGVANYDISAIQTAQDYTPLSSKSKDYYLNYPKGSTMGTLLHEIFEKIDFKNYIEQLDYLVLNTFHKYGIDTKEDYINLTKEIVSNTLESKFKLIEGSKETDKYISLNQIDFKDRLSEAEFNFNLIPDTLSNFGNGFIDLMFRVGTYYAILDWKSDNLSETFENYDTKESLKGQVDDRYAIQRVLYSYCLINWLCMMYKNETKEEIFKNHFGGIYYVFIKGTVKGYGNGIYSQTWNSYTDLENEYKKIIKDRVR